MTDRNFLLKPREGLLDMEDIPLTPIDDDYLQPLDSGPLNHGFTEVSHDDERAPAAEPVSLQPHPSGNQPILPGGSTEALSASASDGGHRRPSSTIAESTSLQPRPPRHSGNQPIPLGVSSESLSVSDIEGTHRRPSNTDPLLQPDGSPVLPRHPEDGSAVDLEESHRVPRSILHPESPPRTAASSLQPHRNEESLPVRNEDGQPNYGSTTRTFSRRVNYRTAEVPLRSHSVPMSGEERERRGQSLAMRLRTKDWNTYHQRKTYATGMMDVSLITANANQLRYIVERGNEMEFYHVTLVLIIISIILQLVLGGILIFMSHYDVSKEDDESRASHLNDWLVLLVFVVIVVNVFLSAFLLDLPPSNDILGP